MENRAETMPDVLKAIKAYVKQYPDMRVGQLIYNVCSPGDCFNIENSELAKRIYNAISDDYL